MGLLSHNLTAAGRILRSLHLTSAQDIWEFLLLFDEFNIIKLPKVSRDIKFVSQILFLHINILKYVLIVSGDQKLFSEILFKSKDHKNNS